MPLTQAMKLISADDHIIEHPRVWQDRLPAKFKDAGPKMVEVDKDTAIDDTFFSRSIPATWLKPILRAGEQTWFYEGHPAPGVGRDVVAGLSPEERIALREDPKKYNHMRPGCWSPADRIKDMDVDGVHAQLGFPSWPGFAGTRFLLSRDFDLAHACVVAYNDFVIDEWCGFDTARLIPMVILPLWDQGLSVAEIERTAAKGAKAISFPENPAAAPVGLPSIHTREWDPVFAAAQDAQLPLCLHFGTSGTAPLPSTGGSPLVTSATIGTNSIIAGADFLFSHLFHTFPELKVSLAEGGFGWVPWLLERSDYTWSHLPRSEQGPRPSEVFKEHVYVCGIDDEAGIALRDRIGIDRMLLESDYPHNDSLWPNTRKRAAEMLEDVPDHEAHKIAELNARRLFRHEL